MRILIAAGGTGGHVFPALAIARALREMGQGAAVELAGTGGAGWWNGSGFPFHEIRVKGLKGKKGAELIGSLSLLPSAFWQSARLLSRSKPAVTVGIGGYASAPLVLASWIRGIPTLIHEQNSFPGLANRILAPLATRIAYSFPRSLRYFRGSSDKAFCTGNPIRKEILQGRRGEGCRRFDLDPSRFTLLSFGGSQGARKINASVMEALPVLSHLRGRLQFLHASGEKDYATVKEAFARSPFPAQILPFIRDMASAYAVADFVICRAGATTIAELAALGKPALLIPYPYAANDHQRLNAEALVDLGGARMVLDHALDGPTLVQCIEEAFSDPERLQMMGKQAKTLARIDADEQIAHLIMGLAKGT